MAVMQLGLKLIALTRRKPVKREAHMRGITSLILMTTCLGAAQANAASFDCAKAGTVVEKTICADPALSKLDERMAAAYKARLTDWGGANAAYVKADQRAYLRLYHEINHPEETEIEPVCQQSPKKAFISCLSDLLGRRVGELENADYKLSGVYFRGEGDDRDAMVLIYPARDQGIESIRVTLKDDGAFFGTWATPEVNGVSVSGQTITAKLPADSPLTQPCTLKLNIEANALSVVPAEDCDDVDFEGTYTRDITDLLANHELDVEF